MAKLHLMSPERLRKTFSCISLSGMIPPGNKYLIRVEEIYHCFFFSWDFLIGLKWVRSVTVITNQHEATLELKTGNKAINIVLTNTIFFDQGYQHNKETVEDRSHQAADHKLGTKLTLVGYNNNKKHTE